MEADQGTCEAEVDEWGEDEPRRFGQPVISLLVILAEGSQNELVEIAS